MPQFEQIIYFYLLLHRQYNKAVHSLRKIYKPLFQKLESLLTHPFFLVLQRY